VSGGEAVRSEDGTGGKKRVVLKVGPVLGKDGKKDQHTSLTSFEAQVEIHCYLYSVLANTEQEILRPIVRSVLSFSELTFLLNLDPAFS